MKWNPFAKGDDEKKKQETLPDIPGVKKPEDMNMLQRLAYKRVMAMNPAERAKLMQKMMTPKNVKKHEKEIREQIEELKKSGKVSDDQIRLMKARLGLK
ncbi:MAG: hypothetical protein KBC83_04170 [Candidatus Moranbacteria bacterium]|jgi:hypothetical protein|nr:hypothetical protein [Candidatus Moranbacteria bacterium]MBP9801831.1 hypothetical protein [Candidatus Moranbacteria bacterium]